MTLALALAAALHAPASVASEHETALAEIERLRDQGRWLDALSAIGRAQGERPDDPALYRLRALTLLDLGSSYRAWTLYQARPELFGTDEARRLRGAGTARLINWGRLYAESEQARDEELALAGQALQNLRDPASADLRNRFDEIALLNLLERHAEVIERYRALQDEGVELPPYVLASVAGSLLAERHPREAIPLYQQVERGMPDAWDPRLQLGYAYSESEDFDAAYAHLEQLKAAEPAWLHAAGARRAHSNLRHYEADRNLALMRLYGQDSVGAQQRLEALAAIGPNDASLQASVGEVYRQRGWSERALERFRMAGTLDPEHIGARIGQVGALLDLDRVDLARPLHDRLLADHPRNVQVGQMARDWDNRLGWQWQLNASTGRSDSDDGSAGASPLGSRDGGHSIAVQGPLLGDRWRITAWAGDTWADFQGARVHDRRTGVGVRHAYDGLRVDAGVDRILDDWTDSDTGYHLSADWRLDDAWRIGGGWYRNSPNASLQARRSGIGADELSLAVSWTPSDHGRIDARLQQLRYDDGNRREALTIDTQRHLLYRPHLWVDGLLGGYTSRGSRDDAPYFNPSRDASLELGARLDHITWRDYDRHLRQRLTAGIGPYWQEGYGSHWVPRLRYAHEWRFGTGRLLEYGVNWSRPVYDGTREEHLGFDLEFRWGE